MYFHRHVTDGCSNAANVSMALNKVPIGGANILAYPRQYGPNVVTTPCRSYGCDGKWLFSLYALSSSFFTCYTFLIVRIVFVLEGLNCIRTVYRTTIIDPPTVSPSTVRCSYCCCCLCLTLSLTKAPQPRRWLSLRCGSTICPRALHTTRFKSDCRDRDVREIKLASYSLCCSKSCIKPNLSTGGLYLVGASLSSESFLRIQKFRAANREKSRNV